MSRFLCAAAAVSTWRAGDDAYRVDIVEEGRVDPVDERVGRPLVKSAPCGHDAVADDQWRVEFDKLGRGEPMGVRRHVANRTCDATGLRGSHSTTWTGRGARIPVGRFVGIRRKKRKVRTAKTGRPMKTKRRERSYALTGMRYSRLRRDPIGSAVDFFRDVSDGRPCEG